MEHSEMLRQVAQAVIDMDVEGAAGRVDDCLAAGLPPARILAEGLSSGMRTVGEKFKNGEYYMPDGSSPRWF